MMSCFCTPTVSDAFHPLSTPARKKLIKMILIGPSGSGKTSIMKQFQKMSNSSDEADIENMTSYIKESIMVNMKTLCDQSLVLHQHVAKPNNPYILSLRDDMLSHKESHAFTADIAYNVRQLWNDDLIQSTAHLRECFQLDENAEYFFNKMEAIACDDYVADFADYVRASKRSTGYSRCRFVKDIAQFGEYGFEILDVSGARSERKKWFDRNLLLDVRLDAIIYVVPLSDYDRCLFEDGTTNRLKEAIQLFTDTMLKGEFFRNKSVFILFNKYDVFVQKIQRVPITKGFDDFNVNEWDPYNPHHVLRFIATKFTKVFNDNQVELDGPLRIFRSNALDTDHIERIFCKLCAHIMFRQSVEMIDMIKL